jgi:hypothetical protein
MPVLDGVFENGKGHVGAWRTLRGVAETVVATRPARKNLEYMINFRLNEVCRNDCALTKAKEEIKQELDK